MEPTSLYPIHGFRRGAHCAPGGYPLAKWAGFAPARRGRARGGQPKVFPLLSITLFPSGRAARARVSDTFRLPPGWCCDRHGIGCHPKGAVASLQGGICPSCCFGKVGGGNFSVTHLARKARPYLRQQMPQIFGQMLKRLLPPKGKGVIRKRGETLVSPLLCACRAQRPASRRPQAAKSPASEVQAYAKSASAAPFHWARDARPYGVHAHPKYITAAASSRLSAPRR